MHKAQKDERDISRSPKIVQQKRAGASEYWIITAMVEYSAVLLLWNVLPKNKLMKHYTGFEVTLRAILAQVV